MVQRICIGVDGSDSSRRGVTAGIAIAETADAAVDVVHVTSDGDDTADPGADPVLDELGALVDDASVSVERHVLGGDPAGTIVRFTADTDTDLLVLGRRGLGGVGDRLLGSTVHSVLRRSDCSVLTVPESDEVYELSDLLIPSDGSAVAERAAPIAAAIAAQHDADVHACYAVDLATAGGVFGAGGATEADLDRYESEGREHLDRLAAALREHEPSLSVHSTVVTDTPHAALTDYVEDHDVDLVVIASKGDSWLEQAIGGVTDRLFDALDVPVLVVPHASS